MRALLALICVSVIIDACDPVAAVYVRQSMRPAPSADCVATALASSTLVSRVDPARSAAGDYTIEVRDSTARTGSRPALVEVTTAAADSARLRVIFHLRAKMTWDVGAEESHRLGRLASAIARTIQAGCAPGSPSTVSCRVEGMWWTKSCDAAG